MNLTDKEREEEDQITRFGNQSNLDKTIGAILGIILIVAAVWFVMAIGLGEGKLG